MIPWVLLTTVELMMPPSEFVVDTSFVDKPVNVETSFTFRFESWDGRSGKGEIFLCGSPSVKGTTVALQSVLDDHGWRYDRLADGILIIRGSKTSPVRKVTFTGKVWTPNVTRRFITPPPANGPKK